MESQNAKKNAETLPEHTQEKGRFFMIGTCLFAKVLMPVAEKFGFQRMKMVSVGRIK
ncbi:MAG: hypothetical protein K9M96_10245 [Deltaproteobacteria bacterium]|nr:hypothetical protein [Deltaproteobacteria bacterium]